MFDWDNHYKSGGRSSPPLFYPQIRDWKHEIVNKYCDIKHDSIIDIGCGDLQFWVGRDPVNYTGIDISQTIIADHREKYPDRTFICASSDIPLDISADVVICLNVLFHLIDDNVYINTLKNMKLYAKQYIIIYTWNTNPFDLGLIYRLYTAAVTFKKTHKLSFTITTGDGNYQKYRPFKKYAKEIFNDDFELIGEYTTDDEWKASTMYIFKRVVK